MSEAEPNGFLAVAGFDSPSEHILMSLLAFNGLRVLRSLTRTSKRSAYSATARWRSSVRATRRSRFRSDRPTFGAGRDELFSERELSITLGLDPSM
jgi:hypothetical protein